MSGTKVRDWLRGWRLTRVIADVELIDGLRFRITRSHTRLDRTRRGPMFRAPEVSIADRS